MQRFTARLTASIHRYFRDVDDERGRFAELISNDQLLNGFTTEIFLGGLTRTADELSEAEQSLDHIEQQLAREQRHIARRSLVRGG